MKIDNTLERIAKETVIECKSKKMDVNNQDVYRCLEFVINCLGLGMSKAVPVEIPYLGKIIPKVRVGRELGSKLGKATTDEEKEEIKKAILAKSAIKKKLISEYKNQKAFTEKEIDELLKGYINKNYKLLSFAFNSETKRDFLNKLNTTVLYKKFRV